MGRISLTFGFSWNLGRDCSEGCGSVGIAYSQLNGFGYLHFSIVAIVITKHGILDKELRKISRDVDARRLSYRYAGSQIRGVHQGRQVEHVWSSA